MYLHRKIILSNFEIAIFTLILNIFLNSENLIQKHYLSEKKQVTKDYMLYDTIYITFQNRPIYLQKVNNEWVELEE